MYRIVVLDYCISEVRVFNLDTAPEDDEEWLYDHDPDYKSTQCYYMSGNDITLREEMA